jgi:ABC-2 type transport system permease protein
MRNVLAIAGKESRIYLTTWTSYILFGAFMLITAFFFQSLVSEYQMAASQYMQMKAQAYLEQMNLTDMIMGSLFRNIAVFFLFMLPMLTMRLISEERRSKTLELLMTTPVRPFEIVVGKYLAAVLIMSLMLGITLVFPVLLQVFGSAGDASVLDWNTVWIGYFGIFLLGASFVAVGLFTSSVTESQIVAVVMSFAALLMFFVIGFAARGEDAFWQQFLQYLSLTDHLEGFMRGVIRTHDVVYYLSFIFLGLFLTHRVVEAQRWR